MQPPQIGVLDPQKLRHIAAGELAQGALGVGRKQLLPMRLKPLRQVSRMLADQEIYPVRLVHLLPSEP